MRSVNELTKNETEELKSNYFYQLLDTDPEVLGAIDSPSEIGEGVIKDHYADTFFVDEDFFCNLTD